MTISVANGKNWIEKLPKYFYVNLKYPVYLKTVLINLEVRLTNVMKQYMKFWKNYITARTNTYQMTIILYLKNHMSKRPIQNTR